MKNFLHKYFHFFYYKPVEGNDWYIKYMCPICGDSFRIENP